MNLPVIFSKAAGMAKNVAGISWLAAKKHAPEIMIGSGILGFGATIFTTVKATNKTNDILEDRERQMDSCTKALAMRVTQGEDCYTQADYEKDLRTIRRRTRGGIIKAWAPVAATGTFSVISVLGGYRILNGRYVATAAAYKVLESGFDRYRENVVERFGKDVDRELANHIKAEDMEKALAEREENRKLEAENQNAKGKKRKGKRPKTAYEDIYTQIFDNYSDRWQRYWTPEQVLHYLKQKQNEANDLLQIRKHIFVNEINDMLGFERTAEGQVTGYIITKSNPNSRVDFGIDDMPEEELRAILSTHRNEDIRVKIRLHPDGLIYNLIDQKDYTRD